MDLKNKILEHLSNPERDFIGNLTYGMKLWKSPSFYYMSKYDITFTFFLDNVVRYFRTVKNLDAATFNERWQTVNRFLLLPCPSNAIPSSIAPKLIKCVHLLNECADDRKEQLLETFLIIALDGKYKNLYKFDYQTYGSVLRYTLEYYKKCLKEGQHLVKQETDEKIVDRILADIKIYANSPAGTERWRDALEIFLTPLAELVLLLETRGIKRRDELLELFQQLYFKPEHASKYYRIEQEQNRKLFMGNFDAGTIPLHVIALLMEGFIRAYRDLKLEILLFLKYFLQNVFVVPKQSILADNKQVYALTQYVFRMLRKYFVIVDQQLMTDIDFTELLTTHLHRKLTQCVHSQPELCDFFELICTINQYNPLVLEHRIVDIILKVMFVRKAPETLRSYQAMLISTVEMFMKLNKSENFCDELFMKLSDYLEANDLDSRIQELRKGVSDGGKRKAGDDSSQTPAKQIKLTNGSPAMLTSLQFNQTYWTVLFTERVSKPVTVGLRERPQQVHNCWPELTFAWPDADGRLGDTMKEYTKQLLTKRSLSLWKKLMILLTDFIELPEQSQGTLLQLELALCWMCYFFAGNTLIENSNLFWSRLVGCMEEFDQLLCTIARKLLFRDESVANSLYGAFLNVVYYYGNYRMMVFYYRPDSIEEINYDQLYGYLDKSEWRTIEQRVSGRDAPLLNRLLLQKLRVGYFKQSEHSTEEVQPEEDAARDLLIDQILKDKTPDTLRPLLLDRSTNVWFMGLLNKEQRRRIAYPLLDPAYCPLEDIQQILAEVASDHALLEVFLLGAYRKLVELLGEHAGTLKSFPLETLLEQDEAELAPKLRKLLEQRASNRNEAPIHLQETVVQGLDHLLSVLDEIRIDSYGQEKKSMIVAVHLLLLAHLNATDAERIAERFKTQLIKFMLLGSTTSMSPLISLETLFQLFGVTPVVLILLQHLIENLTEQTFEEMKAILANFSHENDSQFEVLLLIYNFEQRNKSRNRKFTLPAPDRTAFLDEVVAAIDQFILQKDSREQRKSDEAGFNVAIKACVTSIRHKAERQEELSEQLRDHIVGYIKQAMKVFSYNSDMLLTRSLAHKDFLQLDPKMVGAIEEKCWQTFLTLMQERTSEKEKHDHEQGMALNEENPSVSKTVEQQRRIETIITALVGHFTAEQYMEKLNLLNRIEFTNSFPDSTAPLKTTMAIFTILSKKGLPTTVSQETCKVFVRSFASVVARDVMGLCVLNQHRGDPVLLDTILECFRALIENRKLRMFDALLDYVLQFLSAINIAKQTSIQTTEEEVAFFKLHRQMSHVMYVLLQARLSFVASRLPSYLHVYEGLLAAIICYKGDAELGKSLTSFEILTISDLMLPMQRIINIASKKLVKQLAILAPYVLGQILHTIVQCKRATTEHNRIASNVHNVCFSLIDIYDPQAPSYLLRTLDESSRLLFTDITKRYHRNADRKNNKLRGKSN